MGWAITAPMTSDRLCNLILISVQPKPKVTKGNVCDRFPTAVRWCQCLKTRSLGSHELGSISYLRLNRPTLQLGINHPSIIAGKILVLCTHCEDNGRIIGESTGARPRVILSSA